MAMRIGIIKILFSIEENMAHIKKNKKFIDPRYFLYEQAGIMGIIDAFVSADANTVGDPAEDTAFKPGTQQPAASGTGAIIERGRSLVGKNWIYDLDGFGGKPQGGPLDPKPDPAKIPMGSAGAKCDCTGFASWATGRWQKTSPWSNGLTNNLGEPALNPMPGDIIHRGPIPNSGTKHGHVGIVSSVTPPGSTSIDINEGRADVGVIHCTSAKVGGGAVVENPQAMKNGWAGKGQNKAKVMFFRPTKIMDPKYLEGTDQASQQGSAPPQPGQKPTNTARRAPANESLNKEKNDMRHKTWDKMMHYLLAEQKQKRRIAERAFAGKKELDNDEDGVPKWADKDDKNPKVGSKGSKPKGKKGKVPAQLKMHIKKKKKEKIDEQIEELEKTLFVDGNPEKGLVNEGWGSVLGSVASLAAPYAIDWAMKKFSGGDGQQASAQKYSQPEYDEGEEYEDDEDVEYEDYGLAEYDEGEEEEEYEEEEEDDESCPFCGSEEGYDMYSGECEECGYEAHKSTPEEDIDDPEPGEGWGTEEDDEESEEEYLSEAQVKKKQPRLGKVTRNPSGSKKKFHVYVKCGGRVKKISFGDPGLSIKRDSAARRKNFRARHKCDKPAGKDRCTARYWSCYQWRAGKKVEGE